MCLIQNLSLAQYFMCLGLHMGNDSIKDYIFNVHGVLNEGSHNMTLSVIRTLELNSSIY